MFDLINAPDAKGTFLYKIHLKPKTPFLLRYAKQILTGLIFLFSNSLITRAFLSISAVLINHNLFSLSYYHDHGWTIADKVNRYTLNFRNNYNFQDKLSAGFLTTASVRQQKAPGALNGTAILYPANLTGILILIPSAIL